MRLCLPSRSRLKVKTMAAFSMQGHEILHSRNPIIKGQFSTLDVCLKLDLT